MPEKITEDGYRAIIRSLADELHQAKEIIRAEHRQSSRSPGFLPPPHAPGTCKRCDWLDPNKATAHLLFSKENHA